MTSSLLGPPEIRDTYSTTIKSDTPSDPSNPSIDALVSTEANDHSTPLRGHTENGADTYLSTGNPCLDFFFHVLPDTPKESLEERLDAAWNHDPLTTLKLICNLRGVRGTGKSDKEGFYTAALWLHAHDPKTLACNLEALSKFGYFKDFPEILYRILEGHEIRAIQKSEWVKRNMDRYGRPSRRKGRGSRNKTEETRELIIANAAKRNQEEKEKASLERKDKKIQLGMHAFTRYVNDPDYRFLHERVSDLFADRLRRDVEFLKSGETNKMSLAAKWCPSIDSSFDKATLICESIAKKVFTRESFPEYEGVEEAHYAYRVRDRLRKEVLVPLRKTLQLPEVYMGAKEWDSLPYNRVASVAMKSYKEIFLKHDEERFNKYLEDAKTGKTTIAAGAVLPHEIIGELEGGDGGQVAELQWKRMVDDLKKKGSLTNCIAISDVSGSMSGIPMEVSVALGLLVSELSEEPWKGKLITFSANPQLHLVQGDDLRRKTDFVRRMEWGMNTDFQKVFDLILNVVLEAKLKPEEMIKRVFVFSDMEFDQARVVPNSYYGYGGYMGLGGGRGRGCMGRGRGRGRGRRGFGRGFGGGETDSDSEFESEAESVVESETESKAESEAESEAKSVVESESEAEADSGNDGWETDYKAIVRKYTKKGYGEAVPEIVFWNLRDSSSTPVTGSQKGVALVSGYSKNLIKMFLDNDGEIDPVKIMEAAISGEEYQKLVVIDEALETSEKKIGNSWFLSTLVTVVAICVMFLGLTLAYFKIKLEEL